jgi:flagellar basal-body rod protein FlgG
MLEGLRTAAAGMEAMQQKLDGVANDLANANTNGYKQVRMGFEDLLYEQAGRGSATGVMRGTGSLAVQTGRNFEQGALKSTGDPLDVAIEGQGFMKVKLSDGRQALTRDGDLQIDGQGRLATSQGALLQPPITVPAGVTQDQLSIQRDGTVTAAGKQIGRIQLVTVRSTAGLLATGDNNSYVTTAASGQPTAAPAATTLTQGSLEASNTDLAQSMVDMIDAQRTYQLTSKAIQTADSMMEIANGVKR